MRTYSIYIIKNRITDKVYIGQTCQSIEERFKQHKKPSTFKLRGTYKIYNAMKKYGVENFKQIAEWLKELKRYRESDEVTK